MLGAFRWDPRYVVGAGLGVILSAVYMLWMFQRVYYGKVTNDENATLPDLHAARMGSVVPLCAVALVMGVFPAMFLKPMEPAVTRIVERMQNVQTLRVERERIRTRTIRTQSERFERSETSATIAESRTLMRSMSSIIRRHRPDALRDPRGARLHGGRSVPRARRADADRRPRASSASSARRSRRRCSGIATRSSFGVIVGRQLRPVRHARAGGCRHPDDHVLVAGRRSRRHPGGRVLRAGALRDRRHDHDGDGERSAGHLHRARDPVARGLRADRDPPRGSARDRGGVQVLPARRVLERVLPLRHRVHVRPHRQHAPRPGRRRTWPRSRCPATR